MPAAGQILRAVDFTAAETDVQSASGTTTSTTYTATLTGGTACATTFIAPTSGKVTINYASRIANSTTVITYVSFRVRTGGVIGSGSDIIGANDSEAILHEEGANVFSRKAMSYTLEGLTPGATYNVQMMFRVNSASTGSFANKDLAVIPLPA